MSSQWQRMNYRIRDRLVWSSMPMLLLSLGVAGLCSWALFGKDLTHTRVHHNSHELVYFRQAVRDRAVTEALSVTTMGDDYRPGPRQLVSAVLTGIPAAGMTPEIRRAPTAEHPGEGPQERPFAAWWRDHREQMTAVAAEAGKTEAGETGAYDVFPGRQVIRIFPQFFIGRDGPQGAIHQSILPVMVQLTPTQDRLSVAFLDLGLLLHTYGPEGWWSAMDPSGLVVASSDPLLQIGKPLATEDSDGSPSFLASDKGSRFVTELAAVTPAGGWDLQSEPQGRRVDNWLVVWDQPGPALILLTAVPARSLDLLVGRFILISMGVVLLALVLTLLGVVRVVNGASSRLYDLGGAMRTVAKGDLDCRLKTTQKDEVATLITYFNNMADDLRENRRLADERSAQLRSSVADLKRLDKAKQEFLTLVSHEVRTPLTAIKGGVEYLRSSTRNVPAQEMELLESHNLPEILDIIDKSTRRLGGFMNDATVMANVQALNKRLTINSAPVGEILHDILQRLSEPIARLGLEINDELGSTAKWNLLGDVEMLSIALEKVIDNAVNHNLPEGRVLIREVASIPGFGDAEVLHRKIESTAGEVFEHSLWAKHAVQWRLIEVFNTGAPIPRQRRAALFTEFELVGPIENHQRGTGLSMPIVKTALERHGGGVFVASDHADGNSFYLLVPSSDQSLATRSSTNLWDSTESNV